MESAIVALEADYGVPVHEPRFEPLDELVSCILTQHTSDANAYPAFERMKAVFPTWEAVVDAGPEALSGVIRSAGLANQKAKHIVACLGAIKERTGGYDIGHLSKLTMRDGRDWLMALPGVGPKTASIVLCFAFGMGAIPVDTHVHRVSMRLGMIPAGCTEAKAHDLLLDLVPPALAFRFHVALIRHGRQVCKAPLPRCQSCAILNRCRWFREGGPEKRREELNRAREARGKNSPRKVESP